MSHHKCKELEPSPWLAKRFTYAKYDGKVHIDEKIASLISYAWKLGINTTSCCQAHRDPRISRTPNARKNMVWILFSSIISLKNFCRYTKECDQKEWFVSNKALYFPKEYVKQITKLLKDAL